MQTNPKLEGSSIIDCRPQTGPCALQCNQCFYNRMPPEHLKTPNIPTLEEAENKIVRMNAEGDSNILRDRVINIALRYHDSFFNTSVADILFPRPVVLTVNSREEDDPCRWIRPRDISENDVKQNAFDRLMFVRFRVSMLNSLNCCKIAQEWAGFGITSVFTFMRYYDRTEIPVTNSYEKRMHLITECWQLTKDARKRIQDYALSNLGNKVAFCGTLNSDFCRDCNNCSSYYWQAKNRMLELGIWK